MAMRKGTERPGLDVLDHAGVHGFLEAWVLTSKVIVFVAVAGSRQVKIACFARLLVLHSRLNGTRTHGLVGSRQEDDLAVGRLSHGLHSLEVADLHGRSRAEDVGSLTHQLGRFDLYFTFALACNKKLVGYGRGITRDAYLCLGSNNLAFTNSLALSSH